MKGGVGEQQRVRVAGADREQTQQQTEPEERVHRKWEEGVQS